MVNKSSLETNLIGSCASKMKRQWITEFSLISLNHFVIMAMSACRIKKRLEIIPFLSICYMSQMFVISLTLKYHMKYQRVCLYPGVLSTGTAICIPAAWWSLSSLQQNANFMCQMWPGEHWTCSDILHGGSCVQANTLLKNVTQLPFPLFPVYTLLLINKRQKDLK